MYERCDGQPLRDLPDDRFGDFALQRQHVSRVPLVLFCPEVTLVLGFYQLHGDADAASGRPYTPLEKVADTKI